LEIYVHGKTLGGVDVVLPRIGTSITDYGLLVVRQFESMGVRVLNRSDAILNSRNKFRALQACAGKKLAMPSSVLTRSSSDLSAGLKRIGSFPMVLKLLQGAQGIGVMLAKDRSSAESVYSTLLSLDKDVLLQQFIHEASGSDVRVLVIDGKVVAAMRRNAKRGEFRANIHRGGWGEHLKRLPKRYERLALTAVKAVGLDIAGVDLLESDKGPMILEINSSPGFQELEKATGINVAREMIRLALKRNRRKRSAKRKNQRH
jgi:ribosomal protein S6--L-glutamate ligase